MNEVQRAREEYAARVAFKETPWPTCFGRKDKVAISVLQIMMEQTGWSLRKCQEAMWKEEVR